LDEIQAELQTSDGKTFTQPIRFDKMTPPVESKERAVKIENGGVELAIEGKQRRIALDEGEVPWDAVIGAGDRVWLVVQTPKGREVRTYNFEGEFLRRLAYAPGDPQPQRVLAALGTFAERWSEQIVLLEQNERVQRVRTLALPQKPADGSAPVWETLLEKAIWRSETFDAIKDQLHRPDGKLFNPEKEFVVHLIDNPLIKDEPTTAHVTMGFNDKGSFLQTTDGLPLRRVTETPHLLWTVIGKEGSGRLLTVFQSDGAAVEEFKVKKLANMMAFDAGDYEWKGK